VHASAPLTAPSKSLETLEIMDWTLIVFLAFKLLVFGTGMFFAIKWHYDRGQKEKKMDKRAVLRAGGKVAAVFVLALLGLGLFTFFTSRMVGLDLTLP
jgi:heme/copper-type cytochrome/quinol oxidase subunit 2